MKQRGFSILEGLVSLGLSSLVISGAAVLWAYGMRRAAVDSAKAMAVAQMEALADEITSVVERAVSCDYVEDQTGHPDVDNAIMLRCAMPASSSFEGTSRKRTYLPTKANPDGRTASVIGSWVWFAFSEDPPDSRNRLFKFTTSSPTLSSLATATPDLAFSSNGAGKNRFSSIHSLYFTIDSQLRRVSISMQSGTSGTASHLNDMWNSASNSVYLNIDRTVHWGGGPEWQVKGTGQNLVTNGFFTTSTTGWTGTVAGAINSSDYGLSTPFIRLNLNGGNAAGTVDMAQTLSTTASQNYVLSFTFGAFSYAGGANGRTQRLRVQLIRTDTNAVFFDQRITDIQESAAAAGVLAFTDYSFAFQAPTSQTRLRFVDETISSDSVDNDGMLSRIQVKQL